MKKYIVKLTEAERNQLWSFVKHPQTPFQKAQRARVLLKADQSEGQKWMTDEEIARALDICVVTVERVRRKCVEEGFEACLANAKRMTPVHNLKVDGELEAQILMLACSEVPKGRSRWTLKLIADELVELELVEKIGRETVRRTLKKMRSSPGKKSSGV